ncbi:MAG TPA: nitric oxide reductase activation protein NorD [Anaeromyxobacteraceae bacterium]|nr:nitric oxide reductase activation protein NorD [Anaeromyxobacteraceae bacterium]
MAPPARPPRPPERPLRPVVGPAATPFADVRRRIALFVRALWDRGPKLVPSPGRGGPQRVAIVGDTLHLPDVAEAAAGRDGATVYRAAAAHALAHLVHSTRRFPVGSLRPVQLALVALVEDARVERLAAEEMPGLQKLWLPFHTAGPGHGVTAPALMARLARALIDLEYQDEDALVLKGRRLFLEQADRLQDPLVSRTIGMLLGNDLGQMRVQFDLRGYRVEPAYRDDNRFLWDPGDAPEAAGDQQAFFRQAVSLIVEPGAGPREVEVEPAAGPPPERVAAEVATREDGGAADGTFRYPEWDHLIQAFRPDFCSLVERPAPPGDPARVREILRRHGETAARLTHLINTVRLRRPIRLRRQMEGDRLDLTACVDATVELRAERPPDPRVHQRLGRYSRDVAVVLLLDLSESMNGPAPAADATALELARDAAVLMADAMARLGDALAIHGFNSNGRHEVEYQRFKEFGEPPDEAWVRLAGMRARFSTRMGTALRHAGRHLDARRATHKLVLLVTDGRPHDVDVHDDRYLLHDARHAVAELRRRGIVTFCVSLDPGADAYVSRIFGARNYQVLDALRRLPQRLPSLYLRLTT